MLCGSQRGLGEIKHADRAAAHQAFWVDGLEEETSEKTDSFFYLVCVRESFWLCFSRLSGGGGGGGAAESVMAFVLFFCFCAFAFRGQTLKWINEK